MEKKERALDNEEDLVYLREEEGEREEEREGRGRGESG